MSRICERVFPPRFGLALPRLHCQQGQFFEIEGEIGFLPTTLGVFQQFLQSLSLQLAFPVQTLEFGVQFVRRCVSEFWQFLPGVAVNIRDAGVEKGSFWKGRRLRVELRQLGQGNLKLAHY